MRMGLCVKDLGENTIIAILFSGECLNSGKFQHMRKLLSVLTIGLFTVFIFNSCESSKQASGGTVMKFNLKKGKTYDYDMMWDMKQQIMQQEMDMNMTGSYSIEVTDEEDDVRTLKTTYNRIKMNMGMMGMNMFVDTDQPLPPAPTAGQLDSSDMSAFLARVMKGMVGKSFTMKVNAEGKITEITGMEEIRKSISGAFQDMPSDMQIPMSQITDQQLDNENMKKMFEQIFFIFPNKGIAVGESWNKPLVFGGIMPMKFDNKYTVKAIEGNHVTLDVNTKITSENPSMTMDGTQTGVMIVDSKTGLVVNAEFNQNMDVTTQGMIMKTTAKGNVKGKER